MRTATIRRTRMSIAPVFAASASFFLMNMEVLIVNAALPTIAADLGATVADQQWVVDGYALPLAALLLLGGSLSDRFGARRAFLAGTALFMAGSAACAFAPTVQALIAGQVALGIAAALVLPSSMSLIDEAYPDLADRARAIAVWGVGGSAATAAGPLLGGVLVPIHWGLAFAVNIPVCAAVLALAPKLPASPRSDAALDPVGQLLSTAGLFCLVAGLIECGSKGFASPVPLALLCAGIAALALFALSQARVAHPMLPLSLFGPAGMRLAFLAGFVMILNWNGAVFLCTQFLQTAQGLSPLESGLAFAPAVVTGIAGNLASARCVGLLGVRRTVRLGIALMAAGFAIMLACLHNLSAGVVAAAIMVNGMGGALTTPCLANIVLTCAPDGQSGVASAVFNAFRQVGGSLGIAAFGAMAASLHPAQAALAVAFSAAMAALAALFWLARTVSR